MISRRSSFFKCLSCFLAVNLIVEIIAPGLAYGLTSGPSQPEVQSFEPAGTSQMVDLFSGDFTYNIPLFELPGPDGGYPFNLSYHSGISMDQEASWVGLGWNINPGAINRQMRGLPDEFKGDAIEVKQDIKEMHNFGINAGGTVEFFGADVLKGVNGGLSLYYNNYRGFGYGMNAGVSLQDPSEKSGVTGGVGLSFDSQNGIGGKLSLGYQNASAGLGFNSESGLDGSFGISLYKDKESNQPSHNMTASILGSSTHAYSPSVGMEYRTTPLSINFRTGAGVVAYGAGYVGGFYNVQKLKTTDYTRQGYGYFYLESQNKPPESLLDFNREKQTLIHEKSPNLPIPVMTADFYNISGQGTGGMFRAWRNEYGSVYDPYAKSTVNGGSIGVDIGVPHFGLAGSYTHGKSTSGGWDDGNDLKNDHQYLDQKSGFYEPAYFQVYGEHTAEAPANLTALGGGKAIRPHLQKMDINGNYKALQEYSDENGKTLTSIPFQASHPNTDRAIRGTNIEQIQNEWLLDGNQELLPEYKVEYFTGADSSAYRLGKTALVRSGENYKPHHFAGMTVVNENGSRYVYGLPAINKEQVEAVFSVNNGSTNCLPTTTFGVNGSEPDYKVSGTDEYFQRTKTPPYAHSYLLTCILGQDYVDINDNGPDAADYGYWVKFTYTQAQSDYQWRNPYYDAAFHMGAKSKFSDNKGSYTYGKKEIWYLATAETKSHVAVFNLDEEVRSDGKGANGELASSAGSQELYSLSSIRLYTRTEFEKALVQNQDFSDALPLQTIRFNYDNSFCTGIPNGTGKLKLKNVGFFYQNNKRGLLNQYEFTYGGANPGYSQINYDRWGNYESYLDQCYNRDLPYTSQFQLGSTNDSLQKTGFQSNRDLYASVWHLSQIKTPTGSKINIEYEADDYAYVQHREATQMFYIDSLQTSVSEVYESDDLGSHSDTRVYFRLEDPIPVSASNPNGTVYKKYLKGLERKSGGNAYQQIYFKAYVNLRDNLWDYVSGYCNVKNNGFGVETTRTASLNIEDDGTDSPVNCYTHGYIDLEPFHDSKHNRDYHPLAALAWQKMRTDSPELLVSGGNINAQPGSSDFDKAMKVKSLINLIPQISKLFKGYLKHAHDHDWGRVIDPQRSVIRLCSPDQKKYGGGLRVKKITTSDEFSVDGSKDVYGQVYGYTKMNDDGEVISSGVASYEPVVGGEENPLRYAKTFTDDQGFKSDNNLFFEYPINESYYPSPSVGYSKVTVRSLATDMALKDQLSSDVGITGETVHEFYTAQDFPTLASETPIAKVPWHRWIPVPLIGLISNDKLTASQGYVVEVNDMHGKPKSVSYYGASKGEIMRDFPVSSVEYQYHSEKRNYEGRTINALVNKVHAPVGDWDETQLGVKVEFFVDHLSNKSYQVTGGADGNLEIPVFPLVYIWPSYSESRTTLKTMVFNKIIHRSGILKKTIATDGQSTASTENIGFDLLTGEPFLTTTTNNYGQAIYNFTSKIESQYVRNGAGLYPCNLGEDLVPARPSSPTFGHISTLILEQLDTCRQSETACSGNAWGGLDIFFPLIKADYDNFYVFQSIAFNMQGGTTLILKDEFNNLYKGILVPIATQYDWIQQAYNSVPILALYTENPIPTSTSLEVFVAKPAEKNVIGPEMFSLAAFSWPAVDPAVVEDDIYLKNDQTTAQTFYLEDVITASALTRYSKGIDYMKIKAANPYKSGERGILQISQVYNYKSKRKSLEAPDLNSDGVYQDSSSRNHFYYPTRAFVIDPDFNVENHSYWQKTRENTAFDAYSHVVESKNAIGIYSSSNYSHYGTSMNWEAVNAKHDEVFFIGFEDVDFAFQTKADVTVIADFTDGHTGNACLEESAVTEYKIDFVPANEGKKYWLSTWIKADEETFDYNEGIDNETRGVKVKFYNDDYTVSRGESPMLRPSGPIIEGWQKIEGTFTVSSSTQDPVEAITIELRPGTVSDLAQNLKMDDLRIMPDDANMKSYVYEPSTYRLKAILDENNFASLYYYDEEGKLFIVKKETERGIYTVQESRSYK